MLKNNRFLIITFFVLLVLDIVLIATRRNHSVPQAAEKRTWEMQSIDTVKYSRDLARQYENDEAYDATIDRQVASIASTGANYIALGTPYDPEFVPYLTRWVEASRRHGLKIWFRGNFSGWEGWFEYPVITRDTHKDLLQKFILDNGNLFEDGDLFTSCTECENGATGDPRRTGDVEGYRKFLIDEYQISRRAFTQIGKNVSTNYFPTNFDVAMLIMDMKTTQSLGGVVVIDHYVSTTEILINTIKALEDRSGGKIILGEFGAPIPDIHGQMSEKEQAEWIEKSLSALSQDENVIGVNYWTAYGGSTAIWDDAGEPTRSVDVLKSFYSPKILTGFVQNEAGYYIKDAVIAVSQEVKSGSKGVFSLPYSEADTSSKITVMADGYVTQEMDFPERDSQVILTLKKEKETPLFKLEKFVYKNFKI